MDDLWLLELESGRQTRVATSHFFGFRGIAWSPDSRWLAFAAPAENFLSQVRIYRVEDGSTTALTSDRFDSYDPAWSRDGKWIYFLSDRHLVSLTPDPWGSYQPGPFLDRTAKVYQVALVPGLRSPFEPPNELAGRPRSGDSETATDAERDTPGKGRKADREEPKSAKDEVEKNPPRVEIELVGLADRLWEVPVPPGNYSALAAGPKHLFWLSAATSRDPDSTLQAVAIDPDEPKVKSVVERLDDYELSGDGLKLLIQKDDGLFVIDAKAKAAKDLSEHRVDLGGWTFPVDPREEWQQMFRDAWRLLRDYFYDPGMHGVDWPAVLAKYLPLVDRVTDRAELTDLFGEVTGELSALHHFVRGGDQREGPDQIEPASLGAVLTRDEGRGWLPGGFALRDRSRLTGRASAASSTRSRRRNRRCGAGDQWCRHAIRRRSRRPPASSGGKAGLARDQGRRFRGSPRGHRRADLASPGRGGAVRRLGARAASGGGEGRGGRDRLCPPQGNGRLELHRVGTALLPRFSTARG